MKMRNLLVMLFAGFLFLAVLIIISASFMGDCCGEKLSGSELTQLEGLAIRGDHASLRRLRFYYENAGDVEKAEYWLRKGLSNSDPIAEFHFASDLLKSDDLARKKEGLNYLKLAAEHGEPTAQIVLGELYRDGELVGRDINVAIHWLGKAAGSGSPHAMLTLVNLLEKRAKTKEEYLECLKWNKLGLESNGLSREGATYSDLVNQRQRILIAAKAAGIEGFR